MNASRLGQVTRAVVGICLLFIPAVAGVFGVRADSDENRTPAPAPNLAHGWDAADEVAPWANDHLPLRGVTVKTKKWIDYKALGAIPTSPASNGILKGPNGPMKDAPIAVKGGDGNLFYGRDFNSACVNGKSFAHSLSKLAALAKVIEDSGRQVVFTVAPDKSTVLADQLPWAVPHGSCASKGIASQTAHLQKLDDADYVPLVGQLQELARQGHLVYWRTDTHWTSTGATAFTDDVVSKFSPGTSLRTTWSSTAHTGDIGQLLGLELKETASVRHLVAQTPVVQVPYDTAARGLPAEAVKRWHTATGPGVVPGRTLFFGDSFLDTNLAEIKPAFEDGTFVFNRPYMKADVVYQAIRDSDRVVLEIVERYVGSTLMQDPKFITGLKAFLAVER